LLVTARILFEPESDATVKQQQKQKQQQQQQQTVCVAWSVWPLRQAE
jgi:hypothetical protein